MTNHESRVDFDALVRAARMERSLAIANAISSVVSAASNGINRLFATVVRGASTSFDGNPKSKTASR